MPFLKPQCKGFSNFASLFSAMRDNSTLFFSSNLIYFGQKYQIGVKFLDFWVVGWKFTKFLMSYLKLQVSFSFKLLKLQLKKVWMSYVSQYQRVIVCTTSFCRGLSLQLNFQKEGGRLDGTSAFRAGLLGKREITFFREVVQFLHKKWIKIWNV